MNIRKTNMYFALGLTTFSIFAHAILYAIGLLIGRFDLQSPIIFVILRILFAVHVGLSIYLSVNAIKASRKGHVYFKANFTFWLKRITAVLILTYSIIHMFGLLHITNYFVFLIVDVLFLTCVVIHTGISVQAVLIKCGVKNSKKKSKIIIGVLIGLLVIFTLLEVLALVRMMP